MKKILLTSAVLFATVAVSFAQTDDAELKVVLTDIKTIEVLTKDVQIDVTTSTNYANAATGTGVTTSMPGHLKVTSTGAFKVNAKAADLLGPESGVIEASKIFLTMGSYNSVVTPALGAYSPTPNFNLGTNDKELFTTGADGGTAGTTFDVDYTLKNVTNIANLPVGAYTTEVMYTIEAI